MAIISEVGVANLSLTGLGADRIISLTEDSENARKVNAIFGPMRDETLAAHPWNFAIRRVSFNLLTTSPEYGFDSQFQIPGEVLRILTPEVFSSNFVIEEDKVLVDDTTFKARCIVRIEDTTKWSDTFVSAFAARLEAELAYSISDSLPLQKEKFEIFKEKIRLAKGVDAQEGTPDELTSDQWINSRRAGTTTPRAGS